MNPLTYFQCRLHIIKFISIMHKFLHSIYFCNKKIELFEFKQLRQNPRSTPVCLKNLTNGAFKYLKCTKLTQFVDI